MTPSAKNKTPIGMRISNRAAVLIPCLRSEEDDVQCQCHSEHDHGQYTWLLVPVLDRLHGFRRKAVNESDQLLFGTRACGEAHDDRDDEAGNPGGDRGPERLSQLAAVNDVRAEVAALHSRYRAAGERDPVMDRRGDRTGKEADECAVTCSSLPEHSQREG